MLHGLTDCPYSLRHLARLYLSRGFGAYTLRMLRNHAPGRLPAPLPQPSLSPKEVEARFEGFLKEPDSDAASWASVF